MHPVELAGFHYSNLPVLREENRIPDDFAKVVGNVLYILSVALVRRLLWEKRTIAEGAARLGGKSIPPRLVSWK